MVCQTKLKYYSPLPDKPLMKLFIGLLLLVSTSVWAQNHGNGGDTPDTEDLATEKCRDVRKMGEKLPFINIAAIET